MVLSLVVVTAVFVVREVARSTTPVPTCTGSQSLEFGCLTARYEALTRVSGAAAALTDLGERRATSGHLGAVCHQLTHVVGRTAGALHGGAGGSHWFGRIGSLKLSSGVIGGIVVIAEIIGLDKKVFTPLRR